jgi:16S rRNA G966 N2-methylase RsmD
MSNRAATALMQTGQVGLSASFGENLPTAKAPLEGPARLPTGVSRRLKLQNHFVRAGRAFRTLFGSVSTNELLYQIMFYEAARALELKLPPLYPVRGAANYSLLYVLLRALSTRQVRVLEIGAGQSSLLINALGRDAVTVEPDAQWASWIGERVAHPVVHAPMAVKTIHGRQEPGFDVTLRGRFDVVLVDSPHGARRRSRWSALELLDRHLADEFLVIFDDAQRTGEMDTASEFIRTHPGCRHRFIHGRDAQCLIFSEGFAEAAFY